MSIFERDESPFERNIGKLSQYFVGGCVELRGGLRLPPLALRVELTLEGALEMLDHTGPSLELFLIGRDYSLNRTVQYEYI